MDNEKFALYQQAKEAYYNGEPIMTDLEFDELEAELGLENKGYVGTRHNPSYTIQHPFIMGSLSKVQIKEDKDGNVDWQSRYDDVVGYVGKDSALIVTPKYDGCSFEAVVEKGMLTSVSTRGDGDYGKDIMPHICKQVCRAIENVQLDDTTVVYRGEVLVRKKVFEQRYADQFANTRSFVAGVLGRDYEDTAEFRSLVDDLTIVIYDVRYLDDGSWVDADWAEFTPFIFTGLGTIDQDCLPQHYIFDEQLDGPADLESIYADFDHYRHDECPYSLDGIVFKPIAGTRINNMSAVRPKDCVAIKFKPMLQETTVIDIEWNLGKNGEYVPVVITNPVIMDGKKITRASGHNYGNLLTNKISIGTKIILSLAGDIIPFIYKVTNTDEFSLTRLNMPWPGKWQVDGCHLMAILSERDYARNKFINSAAMLNIPNIGPSAAATIFEYIASDCGIDAAAATFFGDETTQSLPTNILTVSADDICMALGGKLGTNARKSFKETVAHISLKDVIKSCCFKMCGEKLSEQVANYLLGLPYDFTSMASEGYEWALAKDAENANCSDNMDELNEVLSRFGKTIDDFKEYAAAEIEKTSAQIPVILTGEPNDYRSKGDFLSCHPEYRVTGSWKEVQIVFTNSLDSSTGKMKKAKEKGIEIRLY